MARKSNSKSRRPKVDPHEAVTASIVAALEAGTAPWVCPWDRSLGFARNGATNRTYSGINVFLTWAAAAVNGWADNRYYTFNQIQTLNGFKRDGRFWKWAGEGDAPEGKFGVIKGSKGTKIVHYHTVVKTDKDKDTDEETKRSFMSVKVWTVFNHAQVTWVDGREPVAVKGADIDPETACAEAAALFGALPAKVTHGGSRAAYSPSTDSIMLPKPNAFKSAEDYWAVRAHETVHWTGHKNRCDRGLNKSRFGSEAYAFEELVAELGAAFLCADLGIAAKLQHASYIASWIKVLKDDKKALFKAASLAQAAVRWVKGDEVSNRTTTAPSGAAVAA